MQNNQIIFWWKTWCCFLSATWLELICIFAKQKFTTSAESLILAIPGFWKHLLKYVPFAKSFGTWYTFTISFIWLLPLLYQASVAKNVFFCRKLLHLLQRPADHSEQAGGGSRRGDWVWLTPRGATLHLLYQITSTLLHLVFCSPAHLPLIYKILAIHLPQCQRQQSKYTLSLLSPVSSSTCLGKPFARKRNEAKEIFHLEGGRGGSSLFFSFEGCFYLIHFPQQPPLWLSKQKKF